jgi:hypothetical protein
MVMRIDDRAGGVEHFLGILREPFLARIGIEPASGHQRRGGHDIHSLFSYCFVIASAAKQSIAGLGKAGLPRCARNDGLVKPRPE